MATYTVDMRGDEASETWGKAATALAKAFTPDYDGMSQAAVRKAQADSSYASARASRADAALDENKLSALTNFAQQYGKLPLDEQAALLVSQGPLMGLSGTDAKAYLAAMANASPGISQGDAERLRGVNWGDTQVGKTELLERQGQNARELEGAKPIVTDGGTFGGVGDPRFDQFDGRFAPFGSEVTAGNTIFQPQFDENGTFIGTEEYTAPKAAAAPAASDLFNYEWTGADGTVFSEVATRNAAGRIVNTRGEELPIGGTIMGKPTPGSGDGGGFGLDGTGYQAVGTNFLNKMNTKLAGGEQMSVEEDFMYRQVFHELYFKPKPTLVDNGDGTETVKMLPQTPPAGLYNPFVQAAPAAAAPAATDPAATDPARVPPDAVPLQPAAGVGVQPAAGVGVQPSEAHMLMPGDVVGALKPAATSDPITESASRLSTLGGAMGRAVYDLFSLTGYDDETGTWPKGGQWPTLWQDLTTELENSGYVGSGWAGRKMRGEYGNSFRRIAFGVVEPILRLRTGAAAPDPEKLAYELGLLPQSGLSDEENQERMLVLKEHVMIYSMAAEQMGVDPQAIFDPEFYSTPEGQLLSERTRPAIDKLVEEMRAKQAQTPGGTVSATDDALISRWTTGGEIE